MRDCFSVLRRTAVSLFFAFMTCGLLAGVGAVIAAENPAGSAFQDPYNGGIKLPNGGGEPGRAYRAFINAAYRKDYKQLCRLLVDPAGVPRCLEQKEALDANIGLLTLPKSHTVLGGFMKGDEATLNVAYIHTEGPQSTGFVVMKKAGNRWMISSMGGSGSGSYRAEASGTVDLSRGTIAGSADVGRSSGAGDAGPALGKWAFIGKDNKGIAWNGTLTIILDQGNPFCSIGMQAENGEGRGIEGECKWNPAEREVSFGLSRVTFAAILSPDGTRMTKGTWRESDEDVKTGTVIVTRTGTWTAAYTGR